MAFVLGEKKYKKGRMKECEESNIFNSIYQKISLSPRVWLDSIVLSWLASIVLEGRSERF